MSADSTAKQNHITSFIASASVATMSLATFLQSNWQMEAVAMSSANLDKLEKAEMAWGKTWSPEKTLPFIQDLPERDWQNQSERNRMIRLLCSLSEEARSASTQESLSKVIERLAKKYPNELNVRLSAGYALSNLQAYQTAERYLLKEAPQKYDLAWQIGLTNILNHEGRSNKLNSETARKALKYLELMNKSDPAILSLQLASLTKSGSKNNLIDVLNLVDKNTLIKGLWVESLLARRLDLHRSLNDVEGLKKDQLILKSFEKNNKIIKLATSEFQEGSLSRCAAMTQQVLASPYLETEAAVKLYRLLMLQKQTKAADKIATALSEAFPTDTGYMRLSASSKKEMGKLKEAMVLSKKALAMQGFVDAGSGFVNAVHLLACIQYRNEDWRGTEETCSLVRFGRPGPENCLIVNITEKRAKALIKQKKTEQALKVLDWCTKLLGESGCLSVAELYHWKAELYKTMGLKEKAAKEEKIAEEFGEDYFGFRADKRHVEQSSKLRQ